MANPTTDQRNHHVDLVAHGEKAAQFYIDKPGLFGPLTAIDIYHCIADLAQQVKDLREALAALDVSKEKDHGLG